MDFSDPEEWIPRLDSMESRNIAHAIRDSSEGTVNPRFYELDGSWQMMRLYDLMPGDTDGVLRTTARGKDFLQHPDGTTQQEIDRGEGLVQILGIVNRRGAAPPKDLESEWSSYLASEARDLQNHREHMDRRLRHLLERDLLAKDDDHRYRLTDQGRRYLDHRGIGGSSGPSGR